MPRCEQCGYWGQDVHQYPTYKPKLTLDHKVQYHDTVEFQCDDFEACLDRKFSQEGKKYMVRKEVKSE